MPIDMQTVNYRAKHFSVVQRYFACNHCREKTPIFTLYFPSNTACHRRIDPASEDRTLGPWNEIREAIFPNLITMMPASLAEKIREFSDGSYYWELFRAQRGTCGAAPDPEVGYFMNHCANCKKSIGDITLFDNPGKAFAYQNYGELANSALTYVLDKVPADVYLHAEAHVAVPDRNTCDVKLAANPLHREKLLVQLYSA